MDKTPKNIPPTQGKKLLDQYRDQIRIKQYSPRTEKTSVHWVPPNLQVSTKPALPGFV